MRRFFGLLWMASIFFGVLGLFFVVLLLGGTVLLHLFDLDQSVFYVQYFRAGGVLQKWGMFMLVGGAIGGNVFYSLMKKYENKV